MTAEISFDGQITLGHIMDSAGIDPADVQVIRHGYREELADGELTEENVLAYTRKQAHGGKLGANPGSIWLVFITDGGRRSRFVTAYDNHGEIDAERTEANRFFDLDKTELLAALRGRLVIEWSKDAINWTKAGTSAAAMPVVELTEPEPVPFPGFENLRLTYSELQDVVRDVRYAAWRTALGAVQGIYVIADETTGKLYVGKADGGERILGRWRAYAHDGHGGNIALKKLAAADPQHCRNFVFSILRIFGPDATGEAIDAAEGHYKDALLTRQFGLNRN